MKPVVVTRWIQAAPDIVFGAVSDLAGLPEVVPEVVGIDFLSEGRSGVGTRFRETREMRGKRHVTELEVTEHVPGSRIRMVADSHGTVWDTVFTVGPEKDGARLALTMDARAHKFMPRLLNPLFKGLFKKGIEKHVDAVQAWCERRAAEPAK